MPIKTDNFTLLKSESWKMFDQISPRYDFLNHFLSFGLDVRWRKQLARFLPDRPNLKILDLATGTADVLIAVCQNNPSVAQACGIDLADKMLDLGRQKIIRKELADKINLTRGDANNIPFPENSFHAITIAFGIRNMDSPAGVLKEMFRVLQKEGRALILEFSLPENKILRASHLFYLRNVVPLIGSMFSGHYQAYRYLNQTIESFPYGESFCRLMRETGFKEVKAHPLLGGVATIYVGEKS